MSELRPRRPAPTSCQFDFQDSVPTLEWRGGTDGVLRLIDQTRLPTDCVCIDCTELDHVWEAIRALRVRGAPAIGIAAAYGCVIGARGEMSSTAATRAALDFAIRDLRTSRPTAVNLFWALDRMERVARKAEAHSSQELLERLLAEAHAITAEDKAMSRAIGRLGASLLEHGQGVLTHCNAGSLVTADYGTALAVFYHAFDHGNPLHVYADETRPLLQGARLTTWELARHGIPVTLICDNMAAHVMCEGRVRSVVVGADRIAANGDTANKIGTYGLALLAKAHNLPFYIAAPSSTFDLSIPDGSHIPIEERDPREVTHGFGRQTAPDGIQVYNPAFDITPADLITALITERGIIQPVNAASIKHILG